MLKKSENRKFPEKNSRGDGTFGISSTFASINIFSSIRKPHQRTIACCPREVIEVKKYVKNLGVMKIIAETEEKKKKLRG